MKIITLLNEKGGVGKTTLAVHLAAGLAIKGWRVLLVDADAQGHATISLGLREEPGLYDLLVREAKFQDVLRVVPPQQYQLPDQPPRGHLIVLPGNKETRHIATSISDAMAVLRRFRQLDRLIDVVVFDTSPTPSLLHGSIYLATNGIIYPTKCEFLSFDGLAKSLGRREETQPLRDQWHLGDLEVLGIVPTMFRNQTLEHEENLRKLRERFGDLVWDPIIQRTIWAEAAAMRQPVFSFAPESKASAEAWYLVDRVEGALHTWRAGDVSS